MMNREEAEKVRFQIIERRNYLNQVDVPLRYSKGNLHGGMQNRVARQEDRNFKKRVCEQKQLMNKNLNTVDNYLKNLNSYNNRSVEPGSMSTMSEPLFPKITIPSLPKMSRTVRQGIGVRA